MITKKLLFAVAGTMLNRQLFAPMSTLAPAIRAAGTEGGADAPSS